MKALFKGGPWNGVEIEVPSMPERVVLSRREWTGRSCRAIPDISDAMVLKDWVDYIYMFHRFEAGGQYELELIEEP